MQAPYGRSVATGDASQPQPQPAMPPSSSAKPLVPAEEQPSPPHSQPSSPQVHCSIPVASMCFSLFEEDHFLAPYTLNLSLSCT